MPIKSTPFMQRKFNMTPTVSFSQTKFLALSKKAKKLQKRLFISLPILLLRYIIYGLFFSFFGLFSVCVSVSLSICTDSYNKWYLDKNLHFRVNLFDYENETKNYELNNRQIMRITQCLEITEKVSFNIASEASYVYLLSGQKFIKNAKKDPFWRVFENPNFAVKQCYQTGHF